MSEAQKKTLDYKDLPYIVTVEDETVNDGIRIYDLTVNTPGHNPATLVENVNLHLQKGKRYVVTGDSGSGKTLTANAIMGLHTDGSGLIVTPAGLKIMPMSQTPYFANTHMRGLLNMRPSGKYEFDDKELADVLIRVGLDQLVEQIPGQQPRLMIDELMVKAPDILKRYATEKITPQTLEHIYEALAPLINEHTAKKFRTVQYTTEKQEEYLHDRLKTAVQEAAVNLSSDQIGYLTRKLVTKIDSELTWPAYNYLMPFLKDTAHSQRGKIMPYTPSKVAFYTAQFEKRLATKLARYLANEDTDDKNREIRLNQVQADHLRQKMITSLREEFMRYSTRGEAFNNMASKEADDEQQQPVDQAGAHNQESENSRLKAFKDASLPKKIIKKIQSSLAPVFHAAVWPLSLIRLPLKANKAARELTQNLSFFMARQITTGDNLTLSGGERQKLTIAQILLHKPDVLFMDEITAALNQETAEKLYQEILNNTDGNTIIFSIAHNNYIIKYHTDHLHLTNKNFEHRKITDTAFVRPPPDPQDEPEPEEPLVAPPESPQEPPSQPPAPPPPV